MNIKTALTIAQIIVSIVLAVIILIQAKGSGLSATFGGEGSIYRSKRGMEKILFYATIAIAILFLGLSLTLVILK